MERNNTIVTGLSNEEELSKIQGFDFLQDFTEKEYIFLQNTEEPINKIEELNISLSLSSHREINISNKKLMLIEGEKNISLSYITSENKLSQTSYSYPFNASITLPYSRYNLTSVKIYLLDAYPYVINEYTVYCKFVYVAGVQLEKNISKSFVNEEIPEDFNPRKEDIEHLGGKYFDPEEETM